MVFLLLTFGSIAPVSDPTAGIDLPIASLTGASSRVPMPCRTEALIRLDAERPIAGRIRVGSPRGADRDAGFLRGTSWPGVETLRVSVVDRPFDLAKSDPPRCWISCWHRSGVMDFISALGGVACPSLLVSPAAPRPEMRAADPDVRSNKCLRFHRQSVRHPIFPFPTSEGGPAP